MANEIDWSRVTSCVATAEGPAVSYGDGAVGVGQYKPAQPVPVRTYQIVNEALPSGYRATQPNPLALQKHQFRFYVHTQQGPGVNTPDLAVTPPQAMNVYEVDVYVRNLLAQRGCLVGYILAPQGQPYPAVPNTIPNGCFVNGKQVTVHTEMLVNGAWQCVYWSSNGWNNCFLSLPGLPRG